MQTVPDSRIYFDRIPAQRVQAGDILANLGRVKMTTPLTVNGKTTLVFDNGTAIAVENDRLVVIMEAR